MTYSVETTPEFDKEFKKLDRPIQKIGYVTTNS